MISELFVLALLACSPQEGYCKTSMREDILYTEKRCLYKREYYMGSYSLLFPRTILREGDGAAFNVVDAQCRRTGKTIEDIEKEVRHPSIKDPQVRTMPGEPDAWKRESRPKILEELYPVEPEKPEDRIFVEISCSAQTGTCITLKYTMPLHACDRFKEKVDFGKGNTVSFGRRGERMVGGFKEVVAECVRYE